MKPVTDIRHLVVGGDSNMTMLGDLYESESPPTHAPGSSRYSGSSSASSEKYHFQMGGGITCMDIHEHIRSCPVCSKLYTTSGELVCNQNGCSVKTKSSSLFSTNLDPITIAVYILIFLMAIKIMFA
jgi:hypothetical protein